MSVKELIMDNKYVRLRIFKEKEITFTMYSPEYEIDFELDRNQAHLLKLWLEENLG